MVLQDETPLRNKKKKSLMSPLSDRMGLDMSTDVLSPIPKPPVPQPDTGILGGAPGATLNQNQTVAGKVTDKLKKRKKGAPNERTDNLTGSR
jgi:hypothetical protein